MERTRIYPLGKKASAKPMQFPDASVVAANMLYPQDGTAFDMLSRFIDHEYVAPADRHVHAGHGGDARHRERPAFHARCIHAYAARQSGTHRHAHRPHRPRRPGGDVPGRSPPGHPGDQALGVDRRGPDQLPLELGRGAAPGAGAREPSPLRESGDAVVRAMLTGSADPAVLARGAPTLESFATEPLTLHGVETLQVFYEIESACSASPRAPGGSSGWPSAEAACARAASCAEAWSTTKGLPRSWPRAGAMSCVRARSASTAPTIGSGRR